MENEEAVELVIDDEKNKNITHCFRIVYNAPLNKSNQDKRVTFIEYWDNIKTGKKIRSKFNEFYIESVEDLYRALVNHRQVPLPQ